MTTLPTQPTLISSNVLDTQVPRVWDAEQVADLQYGVMTSIGNLEALHDLLAALTDTHQRGLGFLTPDTRAAINAQVAQERHERRTSPARRDETGALVIGLDWLGSVEEVKPTGHIRAAGTMAPIAVEADQYFTLRHLVKTVVRRLRRAGVCVFVRTPAQPTVPDLLAYLRKLVVLAEAAPETLGLLYRELTRMEGEATRVVDGENRTRLPDPCPHCGEDTLVVHWNEDLIRCDRHPRSGNYGPCRCPDPLCECKTKPIAYRHTWWRTPAAAGDPNRTWDALRGLIEFRRTAQ